MTVEAMFDDWDRTFAELCAGYDKPMTNERRAAYRKSLGKMHISSWQALVDHCLSAKGPEKMPTTVGMWQISSALRRAQRAPGPRHSDEPQMSKWAMAANRIMFQLAYQDVRRGRFTNPIATYEPMPAGGYGLPLRLPKPIDRTLLDAMLETKADYVRMAEEDDAKGQPWNAIEFRDLVYDGLEKILGTAHAPNDQTA